MGVRTQLQSLGTMCPSDCPPPPPPPGPSCPHLEEPQGIVLIGQDLCLQQPRSGQSLGGRERWNPWPNRGPE